jgi:hypothetical protein
LVVGSSPTLGAMELFMFFISLLVIFICFFLFVITVLYSQLDNYKEDLKLLENYYSDRKV